jgi:hypothetical protein
MNRISRRTTMPKTACALAQVAEGSPFRGREDDRPVFGFAAALCVATAPLAAEEFPPMALPTESENLTIF